MANYGMADFVFQMSRSSATAASSATGLLPLTGYITEIDGVVLESILVDSHAFGDSWAEALYTGIRKLNPFKIAGFYDDVAASGPHALLGQATDVGAERYFEMGFGASDVINGRLLVKSYRRHAMRDDLTRYETEFQPTGAMGTATNP